MAVRWFRFYTEALNDPKVQALPAPLFKAWVNLLCIAAGNEGGRIPKSALAVGFQLRIPTTKADAVLRGLLAAGLLEDGPHGDLQPHNWERRQFASDNVTERVRKHREGVSRNVSETLHGTGRARRTEAEQKQNRTEAEPDARARPFIVYEETFGRPIASAREADTVEGAYEDFGAQCFEHCMTAAALEGATTFTYPLQIMRRHKREGCDDTAKVNPGANGRGPKRASETAQPYGDTDSWDQREREREAARARPKAGDPGGQGKQHVQGVRQGEVA